jgi:tetratricopeptide (TPR) repeat protein
LAAQRGREGFERAWNLIQSAKTKEERLNVLGFCITADGVLLDLVDLLGQLAIELYDARELQLSNEFVQNLSRISRANLKCAVGSVAEGAEPPLKWGACFAGAWPDSEYRHPELARDLALAIPETGLSDEKWRTLAMAYLRCGDHSKAITAAEKSMALAQEAKRPSSGIDLLLIATANWQLGNHEQAKIWYSKATELMNKPGYSKEVNTDPRWIFFERHLHTEAQSILEPPIVDKAHQSTTLSAPRPLEKPTDKH